MIHYENVHHIFTMSKTRAYGNKKFEQNGIHLNIKIQKKKEMEKNNIFKTELIRKKTNFSQELKNALKCEIR